MCVCVCVWNLCVCGGGGILKLSELDSLSNFTWGGILKLSELDSLLNFTGGGYSEAIRAGLPVKFHWGGILNFRIGVFCRIWTKISTTPAGSCITDSLSHVETNKECRSTVWFEASSKQKLPQLTAGLPDAYPYMYVLLVSQLHSLIVYSTRLNHILTHRESSAISVGQPSGTPLTVTTLFWNLRQCGILCHTWRFE